MSASVLSLLLLLCSLHCSDGFRHYAVARCNFNSSELKDIEFVYSMSYNKLEFLRFSSSEGKFVGYTELGVMNAKRLNDDPGILGTWKAQKETYCKPNIERRYQDVFPYSATPYVVLSSETPSGGRHPSMLVCSVYSFYPKHIKVTWTRDQDPVTSDIKSTITSTEELADGDWYYQVHSHLEYTPRSGEKISCVVEHVSLKEPLITDWDPSMPESQRNKIAIGASGLILGLILSLAGFIYYKRKSRGRILVPTN